MFDRSRKGETALLIQPHAGGPPDEGAVEEFAELARSAGATVAALLNARIDKPNPAILIGKGKLEEVKAACDATGADLVLVNHALSPVQERNLEKLLERRVVDRTGLILDIFAQRARSHEGKLQVELAQLRHLATRLVRGWTHLERQRSAIGMRGPGETQLETDRRLLQKRVDQLQKRLEKVEVQRTQMRRARLRSELPRVALVGYTNAGKSTLFNALTGADAYAADQLFATLDPTVRKIALPGGNSVLADTVGFVRDLPHELVAAFRSTLSEAREADLLLHVIDAADPLREERIAQVDAVLVEIGAGDIPQMLIYNKIDRVMVRADAAADGVALGEAGHGAGNAEGAAAAGDAATVAADAVPLPDPVATAGMARRAEAAMPVGAGADAFELVAGPATGDGGTPADGNAFAGNAVDGKAVDGNPARGYPIEGTATDGDMADGNVADGNVAPLAASADAAAMPGMPIAAPQVAMAPRHDRPGGTQPDSIARERVWVSALSGSGMDLLRGALAVRLGLRRIVAQLQLPGSAGRLRARLHEADAVRDEVHDESGWSLGIDIALADAVRLAALPDGGPLRALLPRGEVDHT